MKQPLNSLIIAPNAGTQLDIVGPYSHWPRKRRMRSKKAAGLSAVALAAGTFVHCAMPLIY